jgi:hypothetical protein
LGRKSRGVKTKFKKFNKIIILIIFMLLFLTACTQLERENKSDPQSEYYTHRYSVGGTVSGLDGTVVLQLNGANDLELIENGDFTFAKKLADRNDYSVDVLTHPLLQLCSIENGKGKLKNQNITDFTKQ